MTAIQQFQELIRLRYINSSTDSIAGLFKNLIETVDESLKIPNIWFYANVTLKEVYNSENLIDFNLDEMVKGNGYIYVCRIYDDELNIDPIISTYFNDFIKELKETKGIKSVQLFIINDIEVQKHIDSNNTNIKRVLIPIEIPDNDTNIGFKLEDDNVVPDYNPIIFLGSTAHSAWNYTGKDWKFLSVDFYSDIIDL
jgi:hypothetical protein